MERTCTIKLVDFGALKARVSVQINGMEIRGFKVIDNGSNDRWVAVPSREVIRDGKAEYFNIVRFEDPEDKREFTAWVLAEYEEARKQLEEA